MGALPSFHPAVQSWFSSRLGEPTAPQAEGWPLIRDGRNVLIAAPTGIRQDAGRLPLRHRRAVPARAPTLRAARPRSSTSRRCARCPTTSRRTCRGRWRRSAPCDPSLPELRVLVRTGDTPASERAAMAKQPPHILVTTPESLYLLLTSDSGRAMLSTTRTVIVDEIHALVRDKRGAHLALSLERLEALTGRPLQRLGPVRDPEAAVRGGAVPRGRGPRVRAGGRGDLPRPRPRGRGAALRAVHRVLARAVGGDLRAAGRAGAARTARRSSS